eukprot:626343-Prorocentrum_minimum.AAC.1
MPNKQNPSKVAPRIEPHPFWHLLFIDLVDPPVLTFIRSFIIYLLSSPTDILEAHAVHALAVVAALRGNKTYNSVACRVRRSESPNDADCPRK